MKKLIKKSISFFAVFALMIAFSLQQVTAAEKIRWKVQSGHAGEDIEKPIKKLFENIKTISDGKIRFRYYRSNSIVPNNELWSGVREGNLESAFAGPGFNVKKIPSLMFFRVFLLDQD